MTKETPANTERFPRPADTYIVTEEALLNLIGEAPPTLTHQLLINIQSPEWIDTSKLVVLPLTYAFTACSPNHSFTMAELWDEIDRLETPHTPLLQVIAIRIIVQYMRKGVIIKVAPNRLAIDMSRLNSLPNPCNCEACVTLRNRIAQLPIDPTIPASLAE